MMAMIGGQWMIAMRGWRTMDDGHERGAMDDGHMNRLQCTVIDLIHWSFTHILL